MKKQISSNQAPQAIGPYSQAILVHPFLFISGQLAIIPETGKLVTGDIIEVTQQIMKNLQAILEEAGLNFSHVIKTTIYCTDLTNFGKINEVYGSYFSAPYPARATVQVAKLPLDASVEIDLIAKSDI